MKEFMVIAFSFTIALLISYAFRAIMLKEIGRHQSTFRQFEMAFSFSCLFYAFCMILLVTGYKLMDIFIEPIVFSVPLVFIIPYMIKSFSIYKKINSDLPHEYCNSITDHLYPLPSDFIEAMKVELLKCVGKTKNKFVDEYNVNIKNHNYSIRLSNDFSMYKLECDNSYKKPTVNLYFVNINIDGKKYPLKKVMALFEVNHPFDLHDGIGSVIEMVEI